MGELAALIIQNGENLHTVNLCNSNFSATATTSILTAMSTSPSASTITNFYLNSSANMTEEEACQTLADFLAIAESLSGFGIPKHTGRQITYKVECATEDGQLGKVTVTDKDSGEVFESETSMTTIKFS